MSDCAGNLACLHTSKLLGDKSIIAPSGLDFAGYCVICKLVRNPLAFAFGSASGEIAIMLEASSSHEILWLAESSPLLAHRLSIALGGIKRVA